MATRCIACNAKGQRGGPRSGSFTIFDASLHFANKMDNTISHAYKTLRRNKIRKNYEHFCTNKKYW